LVVSGAIVVAGARLPGRDETRAALPSCMIVHAESRMQPYGYSHVVVLTNRCSSSATCTVATDVNPVPIVVDVPLGNTVEVYTFVGSPSQTFVARVSCDLREAPASQPQS
jgi:hypothetical protein